MDAHEYDKMADKLMVFRGKLPDTHYFKSIYAIKKVQKMNDLINQMLEHIYDLSIADSQGWIK